MYSMMDIHSFKNLGETGVNEYYNSFVDSESDPQVITENLAISKELDIPICEGVDSIYGKPDVSVNLPNGTLEISFEPSLTDTKGEFTSDINEEIETVKSDPFDISPIANPEDPQNILEEDLSKETSKESEDDTPRFNTLQDLM